MKKDTKKETPKAEAKKTEKKKNAHKASKKLNQVKDWPKPVIENAASRAQIVKVPIDDPVSIGI